LPLHISFSFYNHPQWACRLYCAKLLRWDLLIYVRYRIVRFVAVCHFIPSRARAFVCVCVCAYVCVCVCVWGGGGVPYRVKLCYGITETLWCKLIVCVSNTHHILHPSATITTVNLYPIIDIQSLSIATAVTIFQAFDFRIFRYIISHNFRF
jgi:hypothetical protein